MNVEIPRVPEYRRRGRQSTMTPNRLGGVAMGILQGDTINASCRASGVPAQTYFSWVRRGEEAINEARTLLEDEDVEGEIWGWLEDGGGPKTCDPKQWYWSADPPEWWPEPLSERWLNAVFVIVSFYARGRAEQIYRTSITRAAQGDPARGIQADWRAAQFMLTHSFGWRNTERIELTGENGGPVEMETDREAVLASLAALAAKRKELGVDSDELDG